MPKSKKSASYHVSPNRWENARLSRMSVRVWAGAALLAAAAVMAYFPSLNGGFIWDDDRLLTENRLIKAADGLYKIWFTNESLDYYPVTNSTYWFEWRLWGMNPVGYHVLNLLLYLVTSLLIWVVLWKLSIPGAFLAALLFALHPVNVETVAWIAQRKNLLALLFSLLSILCYLKFEFFSYNAHSLLSQPANSGRSPTAHRPLTTVHYLVFYWLSLIMFVLAMLSKGSVTILPVLLLGIIWWQRTGTVPIFASAKMGLSPSVWRWDLLRTAPFFALAAAVTLVNVWYQSFSVKFAIRNAGFIERLLGAACVVWFYLSKAIWPLNLSFVYAQWDIRTGNLLWWLPLLSALALTAVLWRYRRGWSRPFLFAWGYFCVSLVPVLGFTDVEYMQCSLVADHYQYVAILGVIALAAAGWDAWRRQTRGFVRWVIIAQAIVASSALMFLAGRQCGLYRNALGLFQATLEKNPTSYFVHNSLGIALFKAGQTQEAGEHFEQALRLKSDYLEARVNLGIVLNKAGRTQEAVQHFEQVLQLKPDYAEGYFNLGLILAEKDQAQEAIKYFRQALRFKPDYPEAHYQLGLLLDQAGNAQDAIRHFQQALELKPDDPEIHNSLGVTWGKAGRSTQAITHFRLALELDPNLAHVQNNLGNALADMGRLQEAAEHYQQAVRLKPDYFKAYYNLALTYAAMNQSAAAVEAAQKALALARLQGQSDAAAQLEKWLDSNRAGPSK